MHAKLKNRGPCAVAPLAPPQRRSCLLVLILAISGQALLSSQDCVCYFYGQSKNLFLKVIRHSINFKQLCSFIHLFVYPIRADEELVDQKKYLEESCQPKCVKPLIEYQACVKRVEGDNGGDKHCTGQYFDYISCVDKCVAPKLFQKLK
ncbi:hypothetical protein FF1_002547 [Malus domestica]